MKEDHRHGERLMAQKQLSGLHYIIILYQSLLIFLWILILFVKHIITYDVFYRNLLGNSDLDRTSHENKRSRIDSSSTSEGIIAENKVASRRSKLEILELKKRINEYCEEIIQLKGSYQEKYKENEELIKQWNSRNCDQH
ncbi:26112_t:CDS:2, partial [Dentiscutata erythropus]